MKISQKIKVIIFDEFLELNHRECELIFMLSKFYELQWVSIKYPNFFLHHQTKL